MANSTLLKEKIASLGMSITFVAEKCGMSRETFYNRLDHPDFKASEIIALTNILHLTRMERDKIFFNQ